MEEQPEEAVPFDDEIQRRVMDMYAMGKSARQVAEKLDLDPGEANLRFRTAVEAFYNYQSQLDIEETRVRRLQGMWRSQMRQEKWQKMSDRESARGKFRKDIAAQILKEEEYRYKVLCDFRDDAVAAKQTALEGAPAAAAPALPAASTASVDRHQKVLAAAVRDDEDGVGDDVEADLHTAMGIEPADEDDAEDDEDD